MIAVLTAYNWPGNVAEIQRVVRQAVHLAGHQQVVAAHLPTHVLGIGHQVAGVFELSPDGISLDAVEEDLIRQALGMARGNKTQAARLLGLSRATLLYRLDKYAILAADPENADIEQDE